MNLKMLQAPSEVTKLCKGITIWITSSNLTLGKKRETSWKTKKINYALSIASTTKPKMDFGLDFGSIMKLIVIE
jgi:hypothetical protein